MEKKAPERERERERGPPEKSKWARLPPGDRRRGHRRRRREEKGGGAGGRTGGGRVDQVWTPGVRVSAAKMDWLISKHLNPSMSEAAAARKRATSGGGGDGGKIGDGRSELICISEQPPPPVPPRLVPRARLNAPRARGRGAVQRSSRGMGISAAASFGGKTAKIAKAANDKEASRRQVEREARRRRRIRNLGFKGRNPFGVTKYERNANLSFLPSLCHSRPPDN